MSGEHLAIIGGRHERPAPDADPFGLCRRLGSHVIRRLFWERDGHACFDQYPVDVQVASFAYRKHPPELVHAALLAGNLLRPNQIEQCLRRRGRAVPGLAARLTGLALDRRVDAVKEDALSAETEHRWTDDLSLTAIEPRLFGTLGSCQACQRDPGHDSENFARHGEG